MFFLSQAAARRFIAQDSPGKIINIASMLSFQGGIRVPSYTASKSGVVGLTRLLASEWASKRHQRQRDCARLHGHRQHGGAARGRTAQRGNPGAHSREPLGAPEDLAGPVVFLASPASDYVNGYTLAVDGGWLAR